jgi:hypothetical protein
MTKTFDPFGVAAFICPIVFYKHFIPSGWGGTKSPMSLAETRERILVKDLNG